MRYRSHSPTRIWVVGALLLLLGGCATQRDGVYRLAAPYNFAFYDTHEEAARSFYAAHFAHFGAYELLMEPGPDTGDRMDAFEAQVRAYVADPPQFEPPAEIVAPTWSLLAYPTGQAMDWTHMLHSQLYDILTDDRVEDKKTAGERAITYYLSESDAAFSTRGYGHRWMEGGGEWVGAFRETYPGVNGILWAYHWHHAAVYEALMESDPTERANRLNAVIEVFTDSILHDLPDEMPLTAEVAPEFSRMFPAAAHIFDNLHMMHDVVNDIMAFPAYDQAAKGAEIERLRLLMRYEGQDTVVAPAMPMGGGHEMAGHDMGGHQMGMGAMRVATRLPSGEWLPQGHPEARMASMQEFMMPMPAVRPGGDR